MIKVLIVDDSALVRQLLVEILNTAQELEVVGVAGDPYIAREKIKQLNPDVITLDVEMPRMDGITFLGNLMRLRPLPVVMISSLTEQGADVTLRALELGAVDFISKPKLDIERGLNGYAEEIIEKVIAAAGARVCTLERFMNSAPASAAGLKSDRIAHAILQKQPVKHQFRTTDRIIGIGASTGGTEAIKDVLRNLPPDMPGIVISQHIPEAFSAPFAARANSQSQLTVVEAKDRQQILPGHAYIAPGNRHLLVKRDGARYICELNDGPLVNRHKPSVDVMFRSLAQSACANSIGVILTGMGSDGAAGMGELKEAGGITLVQDEKSSVVWGMPGETVKRGFADEVLDLNKIAHRLIQLSRQ
ncbi:MAG: chemotaxis response regulator protein-glutamate methylesterase [Chromatiaceae bacterium]|nr:chemotaxis response regulator protein-glutamate methylesterase [Gammaproteobacteria bacterium]MCP5426805.1 chemotaxis response regulator protein-glutamate methylesterase [Chromatiaceae bacterium]MCB1861523.1 chemotaxis response regulator protein-glutamate methylesterase [Gammaproteobacteria bacterium]MCB1872112.1 chemotaxis response regulator protein-glutamate methylesterase [Gammaproteobacteria bacterium]MCB1881145.1 chemotaxis response regulator protein-glutamate methylesterase [Gammaprote